MNLFIFKSCNKRIFLLKTHLLFLTHFFLLNYSRIIYIKIKDILLKTCLQICHDWVLRSALFKLFISINECLRNKINHSLARLKIWTISIYFYVWNKQYFNMRRRKKPARNLLFCFPRMATPEKLSSLIMKVKKKQF